MDTHVQRCALIPLVVALGVLACNSTSDDERDAAATGNCGSTPCCPHEPNLPDATTFSCEAGPADAAGCSPPPPAPSSDGGAAAGSYPLGCSVTYPTTTWYHPCEPLTCQCSDLGGDAPAWSCPL